jgi:hypothetical protein
MKLKKKFIQRINYYNVENKNNLTKIKKKFLFKESITIVLKTKII